MFRCRAIRPTAVDEPTNRDRSPSTRRGAHARGPRRPHIAPAYREGFTARELPDAQKLLIIIASDADADGLVRALVQRGLAATKIGSTGGFLRRGNTTLLVGVPAAEVETVIALVGRTCPARSELLTLGVLPFAGEMPFIGEPVEVRVGGAVVFVLNVERFERV